MSRANVARTTIDTGRPANREAERHAAHTSGARAIPLGRIETEIAASSESQFFAGLTGDVSTGGVFVATYRMLPIGFTVDLELTLPDGPLSARGTVIWARDAAEGAPAGLGVRFTELSRESRARITRFSDFRAPLYYEADDE